MHCPECGAENRDGVDFCAKCGAIIEATNPFRIGSQVQENHETVWNEGPEFVDISEPVPRTLRAAIKVCFHKYCSSRGRASRREFWFWQLYCFLTSVLPMAIGVFMMGSSLCDALMNFIGSIVVCLALLNLFVCVYPSLTVFFRRMHDVNVSGIWLLAYIFVVKIIGVVAPFIFSSMEIEGFGILKVVVHESELIACFVFGLVYALFPGTDGPNRFGLPPKREKNSSS